MNWEAIKADLTSKLIGALAFAAIGWLVGTNLSAEMIRRVEDNQRRIETIEKTQAGRRVFVNGVAARIEYMCNRDDDCRERFKPMEVPE